MAQCTQYVITWFTLNEKKPKDKQRILVNRRSDGVCEAMWFDKEQNFNYPWPWYGDWRQVPEVLCWAEMTPPPCTKYPNRLDCNYCGGGHERT